MRTIVREKCEKKIEEKSESYNLCLMQKAVALLLICCFGKRLPVDEDEICTKSAEGRSENFLVSSDS